MEEISIGEFSRRSRLSVKALRLYAELGVLEPARVDDASGYRYYDVGQVSDARFIAMLRQLEFPLAAIKELLACDPADAAERITEHWQRDEAAHDARRDLTTYLVNRLSGKSPIMYEVATQDMPERSLLCLKRNVDQPDMWAFGKEFIAIWRERPVPRLEGREGAFFSIYWAWVSADSDGPVEWCMPVAQKDAEVLAVHYPELSLRTEPAHREAFVPLPAEESGVPGGFFQPALDTLIAWRIEQGIDPETHVLKPEDLGMRITYFSTESSDGTRVPDFDFAVPFL